MTFEKVLNQLKSGVAVSRKKWISSPKYANYIYRDSKEITNLSTKQAIGLGSECA